MEVAKWGRLPDVRRGETIRIEVDGEELVARKGETLAAALLASGRTVFRVTDSGKPRGIFCGMGICSECMVSVEGRGNVNACVTPAQDGMRVTTAGRIRDGQAGSHQG